MHTHTHNYDTGVYACVVRKTPKCDVCGLESREEGLVHGVMGLLLFSGSRECCGGGGEGAGGGGGEGTGGGGGGLKGGTALVGTSLHQESRTFRAAVSSLAGTVKCDHTKVLVVNQTLLCSWSYMTNKSHLPPPPPPPSTPLCPRLPSFRRRRWSGNIGGEDNRKSGLVLLKRGY